MSSIRFTCDQRMMSSHGMSQSSKVILRFQAGAGRSIRSDRPVCLLVLLQLRFLIILVVRQKFTAF